MLLQKWLWRLNNSFAFCFFVLFVFKQGKKHDLFACDTKRCYYGSGQKCKISLHLGLNVIRFLFIFGYKILSLLEKHPPKIVAQQRHKIRKWCAFGKLLVCMSCTCRACLVGHLTYCLFNGYHECPTPFISLQHTYIGLSD